MHECVRGRAGVGADVHLAGRKESKADGQKHLHECRKMRRFPRDVAVQYDPLKKMASLSRSFFHFLFSPRCLGHRKVAFEVSPRNIRSYVWEHANSSQISPRVPGTRSNLRSRLFVPCFANIVLRRVTFRIIR